MTLQAKRYDVARIENPGFVVLDINDMMDMQKRVLVVIYQTAVLAGECVALQYRTAKLGVSLVAAFASRFVSVGFCKSNEIEVRTKPVRILGLIKVPMVFTSPSLAIDGRIGFFGKSGIPNRFVSGLGLSTVGMMAALVFGNAQASTFGFTSIDRESEKHFATPTFADNLNASRLCFGNAHDFSFTGERIAYSGKNVNSENCWNPLRAAAATAWSAKTSANAENAADWAISSRADEESPEGSTTRPWSPERTVKAHEYATRKGRYSLVCHESGRSAGLNACAITLRPYSGKLDDLSQHPVKTIINKVLKNDASKWFDAAAATQFNATPLRVVGTSSTTITLTTNGTATATNSQALNTGHVKLIVDEMKERNIPAYTGDDYYALAWPSTYRFFKNQLESIHTYTDAGFQMIMNGEIGRYENVRYIEQTNIPKGGAADSTTWNAFTRTADAWNGGYSDWVYFFGADTVAEAIAVPEEMRGKIPTDYGRSKGVAWYYLGGFGIVHGVNAATNSRNARIVKWDSAV